MTFLKTVQGHQNSFIKKNFFKFKGLYIIVLVCIGFFVVVFQNCKSDTVSTSKTSQPGDSGSSLSYERGYIIAHLPSEGEGMSKDKFDLNTDVHLKMKHVHPDANNFKWSVTRGFESIVDSQTKNQNKYQHRFTQIGSYTVLATAYQGGRLLTSSNKQIVIGAECPLDNILEIELQSGSFTSDSSVTLTLRDASDFTDIAWKVTLPSSPSKQDFNGATLTVDLTGESSGSLIIEVSAVDSAGCLVYRKKELQVTENLQPYINPFQITDDGQEVAVTLENNDIYKYRRPQGNTQMLNLDIKNTDRCEFQVDRKERSSISCQGAIDISLSSNTECQETLVNIFLEDQADSSYQSYQYYNYCPANNKICYFGSIEGRMGQHFCSKSLALASRGDQRPDLVTDRSIDGQCDNSRKNGCVTGEANDGAIADTEEFYLWHCVGINKGETATDCRKRIPINGQCDNSKRNSCLVGQVNDEASADTIEFYKWHCEGEHGGRTASNCKKGKPLNGVCNNNVKYRCSIGTPNPTAVKNTKTHYKWKCNGKNGGRISGTCQVGVEVRGACDNSRRNGCRIGTANAGAVADTSAYYRWKCNGKNGGESSGTCQISKPADGQCDNTRRNGCQSGTANDGVVADTNVYYRWRCDGNGGQNSGTCQMRKQVRGQCDNTRRNGCQAGTANARAVADTTVYYRWRCEGQNGGGNSGTCQIRTSVNGQCDNSRRNGCLTGTSNARAVADTSTHYKWHCVGLRGGQTATSCQRPRQIRGQCDNSRRNGCRTGTANDGVVADTSTYYRWRCDGSGGRNSGTCQINKPPQPQQIRGQCNNSLRNGCQAGTANAEVIADTGTYYRWRCDGQNGGQNSGTCQISKPPVSQYQKHTQSITQNSFVSPQTDILLVLDISGSVSSRMKDMVKNGNFIDQFIAGISNVGRRNNMSVSINIATILAVADHPWSGKIFFKKEPKVLKSTIHSLKEMRSTLGERFKKRKIISSEERGERYRNQREEMNLKALMESVTGTHLTENQKLDFFRPDASLIVIFITDETDVCARANSEYEREGAKMFCSGITHQTVLATLRNLKGTALSIHGIFDSNVHSNHPSKPSKEYAYGIQELVRAVNGVAIPFKASNARVRTGIDSILQRVNNNRLFKPTLGITLRHRPVAGKTKVLLTNPGSSPREIPFVYDSSANTIRIDASNAGTRNAVITVEYYTTR